eukprot:83363_1
MSSFIMMLLYAFFICELTNSAKVIATLDFGFESEAIEYDEANGLFWMVHSDENGSNGNVVSITSNISLIEQNKPNLQDPALSNGVFALKAASGMVADGTYLYVADEITGNITQYDIQKGTAINAINVRNIFNKPAELDGLCMDKINNKIYTTSPGINFEQEQYTYGQGIWQFDINKWEINLIYDINNTILPNNYTLHPNSCVVVDDVLYMVDTRLDTFGAFIMYNIKTNTLSYNQSIYNISGDGLTYDYKNNIFYATSSTGFQFQSIYQYMLNSNMESFKSLIGGFVFPADISFDSQSNVIAVPDLFTRQFQFVQV